MSKLRFDGVKAGLGEQSQSGDRNDPTNYTLICKCDKELGPLARFLPREEKTEGGLVVVANDKNAIRMAECLFCGAVTIVKGTQIARVLTKEEAKAIKDTLDRQKAMAAMASNPARPR